MGNCKKAWELFSDVNGAGTCQRCPNCGNKYRLNKDLGYSVIYKEKCECGFKSTSVKWEKQNIGGEGMTGEISRDWYCSLYKNILCCENDPTADCIGCIARHRKYPTPEQFKQEYGVDVPADMPIWVLVHCVSKIERNDGKPIPDIYEWSLEFYGSCEKNNSQWNVSCKNINANFYARYVEAVIVACTPWGKPPDDWRPE
jgi:hypothetical protein